MRRLRSGFLVTGTLLAFAVGAVGADETPKFEIRGDLRARWEYLSNTLDAQDHTDDTLDDDFDFFPYRVVLGVDGSFADNVFGRIEIQNFGSFGNDFAGPNESFQDPLGAADRLSIDDSEIDLYQAVIHLSRMFDSNWHLRLGRAEHTLGNELHMGDADFYNGITFDGVRATRMTDDWYLDLFYYVTVEDRVNENYPFPAPITGFDQIPFGDNDVKLAGVSAHFGGESNHELEPYALSFRDTDFSNGGFDLLTIGLLYEGSSGPFDWNVEAAIQSGEFEPAGADSEISASIVEAWFGYDWTNGDARSRIHVGTLIASGDDDPLDNEIDSFVPVFPDHHAHNRLGDLDLFGGPTVVTSGFGGTGMSNVTDFNVGYEYAPENERHRFAAALHQLALTESAQAGVTDDAIGLELDVTYGFRYSENIDFLAGISNLSAGAALDELAMAAYGTDADDIMRAYWQLALSW